MSRDFVQPSRGMATVKYIGQRRFGTVIPGDPTIRPLEWPDDDESIWRQVSGECVQLEGVAHALYATRGAYFFGSASRTAWSMMARPPRSGLLRGGRSCTSATART